MATALNLKRTHILKVRLNQAELDQFNHLAGDWPLAVFARRTLLSQSISPGRKPSKKAISKDSANAPLVRQIAYIGNNLNQIARSLNTHLKTYPDQALNTLVAAHILQAIWERIDDMQNIQAWDRPRIRH